MPFLERLQSAMILKTPMHQENEAHIIEHLHPPFYEAIQNADTSTLSKMLEDGFDIDFHEVAHIPPLIYSIIHKQARITQYLLEHGAHVNISTLEGESALHVSIRLEAFEMIALLLRYGADIHLKDTKGHSALSLCEQNLEIQKLLNETQMMPRSDESCFDSAKKGDLYSLSLTCNENQNLFESTEQGHTLLHLATYSGNRELLIYLLNKGLNIDATDNSGNTALNIAVKFENYDAIVALLIKRKATIDHKNLQSRTAFTSALRNGYASQARLLFDHGANIHVVDNLHTPLTLIHRAILNYPQSADAFRALETDLMIRGAHVNIPINNLKWTPLYMTISKMQTHTLKEHLQLLIQLGAEINYLDTNGRSALMISASLGRYHATELLLNNYANIDSIDNFGWSALMLGVYYNHYKIVELLLSVGADANLTSPQHLTALKIAKQHKREKIVLLLLEYGATEEENTE
ncbi:MAG: ankyrin repeat domain-containing protein [Campylobacterota bacterium]|nr:ankyrin repeat domain-containing protein [Campylobacterota bacterium]